MRISIALVAAVASVFSFSQSSHAAIVSSLQGEVLVNSGSGFRPLGDTHGDLGAGTQVMVRPGGAAMITYASNCSVRVPSGIWAVQASAPCSAGTTVIDFSSRMNQEAPPPADDLTTLLVVDGLGVAAVVGTAVIMTQIDNSASP